MLTDIEPCAVMAGGHQASAHDTDDLAFRVGGDDIGTVASLGAVGTGLTFGLWWMYFTVPAGEMLHVHRDGRFP
jgi:hypothetical protein